VKHNFLVSYFCEFWCFIIIKEAVRNACSKCGFDEKKTAALMALTNPQNESATGKALQTAYSKQILKDTKKIVLADPNYDELRFQHLASVYRSTQW